MVSLAATVAGQQFDWLGEVNRLAEAVFDAQDHQVADVLGTNPGTRSDIADRFPIAAVGGEGDTDLLAIVAGDLEPVRAPPRVACIDCDPSIVAALFVPYADALEKQAVLLHYAVDTLGVGRCAPGCFGPSTQQGMLATVAVSWQIGEQCADRRDQFAVGQRRPLAPATRAAMEGRGRDAGAKLRWQRLRRSLCALPATSSSAIAVFLGL